MLGLVYKGKSHLEMDDDWGYPHFRKPPFNSAIENGPFIVGLPNLKMVIFPSKLLVYQRVKALRQLCPSCHQLLLVRDLGRHIDVKEQELGDAVLGIP